MPALQALEDEGAVRFRLYEGRIVLDVLNQPIDVPGQIGSIETRTLAHGSWPHLKDRSAPLHAINTVKRWTMHGAAPKTL